MTATEPDTRRSADALLTINAGSSSVKFSLFENATDRPRLICRGQIEALTTAAQFVAKDTNGATLAQQAWNAPLDHEQAIAYLLDYLRRDHAMHRLAAVGHRIVHGGIDFAEPVIIDRAVLAKLEA